MKFLLSFLFLIPSLALAAQPTVTWDAVPEATYYVVERMDVACKAPGQWAQIGTSTTTQFIDVTVIPTWPYCYRVRSADATRLSIPSGTAQWWLGPQNMRVQ